jgi:DNA-binding NarL/FixJ family response regulator
MSAASPAVSDVTPFGTRSTAYLEHRARSSVAIAVAVVADTEQFVWRVRTLLEGEGVAAQIEHAGHGYLVLDRLARHPDVVILGEGAAVSAASEAVRIKRRLTARIVVVPATGADCDAAHLISAGIDGVVPASEMDHVLGLVVRSACCGLVSVPSPLRHGIKPPAFSHRERQVLALLVAGLTNEEIAAQLYLAESTVKRHLTSAFRRLGARSRREAVGQILTGDESLRRSVLTAAPTSEPHETR